MDVEPKNSPVVSGFSPLSGKAGTEILITGANLQNAEKVWIGDGEAILKYRVSSKELIAVVTAACNTGSIAVANPEGKANSSGNFTITYPVPSLTTYPTQGAPNDEVLIEGENLDAVTKVLFGTAQAHIIAQSEKELLVQVPFFEEYSVDIALEYSNGTATQSVSTTGNVFSIIADEPAVDPNFPLTAEKGASITITGTNLNLIDAVWFGEYQGAITQRTATHLNITLPFEFTAATTVILKLVYYGTREIILSDAFVVTVPVESTIYFWKDRTIYANDVSTPDNFFDAATGTIYTPCDYATLKDHIYFFVSITASSLQLNNPNNSAATTHIFKCGEDYLPSEKMPNAVKFRPLKTTLAADNSFIEQVKNQTLTEISQEILDAAGVTAATSNTPRYFGAGNPSTVWEEGTVLLFQQYDAGGVNVLKVGFIEVLKITTTDPTTDKTSSVKFNCYFQK
jgi:hypothetical protein